MDEKGRASTPAKKKEFSATNPTSQKFTKTDLAKFVNTWEQLPHIVSLGAQKNFLEFTLKLPAPDDRTEFSVTDFHRLVAKAILFRSAEKIVQTLNLGGYRANIVTYALSYLSYRSGMRIDLDSIWKTQGITPILASAINDVAKEVHKKIIKPPGGRNVTEWCKKTACWDAIQNIDYRMPNRLSQEFVSLDSRSAGA